MGKTTLIERLIPEFARLRHRVAAVDRPGHPFDVDVPARDSHRHFAAGAAATLVYGARASWGSCVAQQRRPCWPSSSPSVSPSLPGGHSGIEQGPPGLPPVATETSRRCPFLACITP